MSSIISLHNRGAENYEVPKAPNFIRRVSDDFPVPVGELSDAQLRKLGAAMTEALFANAKRQRTNNTTYDIGPRKGRGEG